MVRALYADGGAYSLTFALNRLRRLCRCKLEFDHAGPALERIPSRRRQRYLELEVVLVGWAQPIKGTASAHGIRSAQRFVGDNERTHDQRGRRVYLGASGKGR